ncbi:MAG: hypothetical protein LC637_10415 [Xanthomonadaceae bacterium]|nr:hypothetical protein [Xanthomonadaceae bacterium]
MRLNHKRNLRTAERQRVLPRTLQWVGPVGIELLGLLGLVAWLSACLHCLARFV